MLVLMHSGTRMCYLAYRLAYILAYVLHAPLSAVFGALLGRYADMRG